MKIEAKVMAVAGENHQYYFGEVERGSMGWRMG
jgi:hypothetical protein